MTNLFSLPFNHVPKVESGLLEQECAALLAELTPVRLAAGRLKTLEADTGETLGGEFGALFDWLAACLERGSVEEYEFRVSCY